MFTMLLKCLYFDQLIIEIYANNNINDFSDENIQVNYETV